LFAMLADLAERVFHLTVIEDDTLDGTNIEGELNRDSGLALLRPGLPLDRSIFVLAHEIGHCALDHPLHRISDSVDHIDSSVTADDLSLERQQEVTGLDISEAALTAMRGYNRRDLYEMQANAFATELLVPGSFLRSAMEREPEMSVISLARKLGVPEPLVRVGLAQALFGGRRAEAPAGAGAALPLDPEQAAAADCAAPALVIAGPGAGKTRVLTARYARLVAEGSPPRSILALTFANKAAGEMRERLARLVGAEQAASVEVVTFHSFGLQLLQQYGRHLGLKLPLRLVTPLDALLFFRHRAARLGLRALDDLPRALENLRRLLDAVARSKEEDAGPDRWAELAQAWAEANPGEDPPTWAEDGVPFYREYQESLRRHGLLDYGDLQMEALRLFSIPEVAEEIRDRYCDILVDEFQDINFVSGLLVRALDGGRGVVWAVGDPRQSIYGFRGASPVNLSRFRSAEYYPTASIQKLTTNYRSVPDIVDAGMAIPVPFPGDPDLIPPRLHAERARDDDKPAVAFTRLQSGTEELRRVASQIRMLREEGRALSDIVVLARKNRHAATIAAALTEAGIPHRWGGPIQDRPAFRVLMSVLLLAADDPAGIAGLTTASASAGFESDFTLSEGDRRPLFAEGRGRRNAARLLETASKGEIEELSESARETCRALLALANALSSSARPHYNLCIYLFEHSRRLRRMLSGEARSDMAVRSALATIGQVLDLAAAFAAQREALARNVRNRGDAPDEPQDRLETETTTSAFLAYLQAALQSGELGVSNELDVEGDVVSIMTAHRSKGLEWPIVFIPYCMEGQFPSKERDDSLPLPPGLIVTDDADPTAAHLREEACLFYVAVTRARDRLFLSCAEAYGPRTKGPVSELCRTVVGALEAQGRIETPDFIVPEIAQAALEDSQPGEVIAPAVSDTIHERDLRLYRECPRKYLYQRIYGLPDGDTGFLSFHSSVYRAAKDTGDGETVLRDRFESLWSEAGPPEDHWQAPLFRRAAERLIERMEVPVPSASDRLYRQEKSVQVDTEDGNSYQVRFTVDEETVEADGHRCFRRHKQSSRLPQNPPDEDVVTLYAMLADQEGQEVEVAYYYPQVGEEMPAKIGKVKKANMSKRIVQTISDLRRGEMPAKPSDACRRCPFVLICDREGAA
jgi:DNA helicase-2/ATP-dependent DNA helicase PcrA